MSGQKSVLSNFFWKFAERVGAQFVTLVVSIVLARILSPEHYGSISIVLVFINLANVFVANGFTSSLVQKTRMSWISPQYSTLIFFFLWSYTVLYLLPRRTLKPFSVCLIWDLRCKFSG